MAISAYPSQLSFSQIQTEFGGSNPISLSEYYAGNANGYVPAGTIGGLNAGSVAIPTSGAISVGHFHNSQKGFVFNVTYSGTRTNTNARVDAIAAGWNQTVPITINCTVATGAVLQATTTANYGLQVYGSWPSGSVMNLNIVGYICGFGGSGGSGQGYSIQQGVSQQGGGGGPALIINIPTAFINNGVITGGGGGGGGGNRSEWSLGGGGGGGGNGSPGGVPGSATEGFVDDGVFIDTGNRSGGYGGLLSGGSGGAGGSLYGYGNNRWGYGGAPGGSNAGAGGYFYSSFTGAIQSAAPGAGAYAYYGANYITSYTGSGSIYGGHGGNT